MSENVANKISNHKHDVFISYSTKNKNVADAIVADFEQHGIKCWYAPRDIVPGARWVTALTEAIKETNIFILIYTEDSNQSKQVMNEVAVAFNAGKTIVPFRLTKDSMNAEFGYYLSRVHWLDALTPPLNQNIESLRKYVTNILQIAPPEDVKTEIKAEPVKKQKASKKKTNPLKIIIPAVAALLVLLGVLFAFLFAGNPSKYMALGIEAYNSEYRGTEDNARAREYFEKASKKNPDAYYYLGRLLERDDKDEEAKKQYETGMEKGSDRATARLGYLYLTGNGVKIDLEKSNELIDKANKQGCIEAKLYTGLLKMSGRFSGEDADAKQALEYFNAALGSSDKEIVAASYIKIGDVYKNGFAGVERDYDKAIENYNLAMTNYPAYRGDANYSIARLYAARGEDVHAQDYYREAMKYFDKAAELGNISALNAVGVSYESGYGREHNGQTAYDYYRKAADSGNVTAMRNIGRLYRYGKDPLQENIDEAYNWYKKAADAGDGYAMNIIGNIYLYGEYGNNGDEKDYKAARQWYEKAAEYGYIDAYSSLGDIYLYGYGEEKNVDKALEQYQKGIDFGSTSCMVQIGYYYGAVKEERDYNEAYKWYMKAVNAGDEIAMYNVGIYYENGWAVDKDYNEAARFYRMAENEGYSDASYKLGDLYYYGYLSSDGKYDYEQAYKHFKIAAETGNSNALFSIGYMYEFGQYLNDSKPDFKKAYENYKPAADAGNADAAYRLGIMYRNGNLSEDNKPDYEQAYQYFIKAGDGGNSDALVGIGLMLETGSLGKKDINAAKQYYEKAAAAGNKYGAGNRGNFYYDDGEYAKAREYYEDKSGWEVNAYCAYRLGKMYMDDIEDKGVIANDLAKAKKYFLKAEEIGFSNQKDIANLYSGLGFCFFNEKDYKRSSQYFMKAADLDEANAYVARNAAAALQNAKNYDLAAQYYSMALDRGYKGDHDIVAELKKFNDQKLIKQDTYDKYVKKWVEKKK